MAPNSADYVNENSTCQWRQATASLYSPKTSSPYLKLPTGIGEPVQGAGPLQTDLELLLY